MPINKLEQHPYLNYYKEFAEKTTNSYYKGIVIGTFPTYAITDTINEDGEVVETRFTNDASMRFFYGSKKSDLWKYLGLALANADPRKNVDGKFLKADEAVENSKRLLYQHKLLISDSLCRTNRDNESADDTALMKVSDLDYVNRLKSVNINLRQQLLESLEIKNIYFTSTSTALKSPFGWFIKIFGFDISINKQIFNGARIWSAQATINFGNGDERTYNLFFLPTPKARGIHWNENRTLMFENYVSTIFPDFYHEINHLPVNTFTRNQATSLSELRISFLLSCYQQAIVFANVNYDGTNPSI